MINRFTNLQVGSRLLKNRIVVPPMASQTASAEGFVTEQTIAHYRRLAQSGAGLIFAEYTFVHLSGRSEPNQLGASSDKHTKGLAELAIAIQETGALAGLQLTHSGGKSDSQLTGNQLMAPSSIIVPVKDRILERPREMTTDDIQNWKTAFISAAERATNAGFDVIELHSAHGYGLNQWLSPITNQRTDHHGGSLFNRLRVMTEIINAIRAKFPELLISVRIPGQDFLQGGLTTQDSLEVARHLTQLGVHLIHVSSGIGGWRRPSDRNGEGYLVDEAEKIQAGLQAPVIGVGGIETAEYIDDSLQKHRFTLAAVGRAILKDPLDWREKFLTM